jgi:hypothetical protein
VTAAVLPFPGGAVRAPDAAGLEVEVRFRDRYHDERLSQGELEALSPVLPELAAELLILMATDSTD